MKRYWLLIAIGFCASPQFTLAQTTYDLRQNWSDAANPNGAWTYRQGSVALPHVADWTPLGASVAQPAWATGTSAGAFLPAVFRTTSNPSPGSLDWQTGDIVCHTTDNGNGSGFGPLNILWTSPGQGVITISGGVWQARDTAGRSNRWSLVLNTTTLTGGDLTASDPYNRANPFEFSTGTGGATAVTNVSVLSGDTVQLLLERTSTAGDFVGMNFVVTFTPIPEPTAILATGLLITGLARMSRSIHFRQN